jgi:hypothetical protein
VDEGQWVAIVEGKEPVFRKSLDDVIASAEELGWPLHTMAVRELTPRVPAFF